MIKLVSFMPMLTYPTLVILRFWTLNDLICKHFVFINMFKTLSFGLFLEHFLFSI